ncbi:MAG: hypothetical protein AAF716_07200 [Cyanobacteria bacterium P01_D01_bin.1]
MAGDELRNIRETSKAAMDGKQSGLELMGSCQNAVVVELTFL